MVTFWRGMRDCGLEVRERDSTAQERLDRSEQTIASCQCITVNGCTYTPRMRTDPQAEAVVSWHCLLPIENRSTQGHTGSKFEDREEYSLESDRKREPSTASSRRIDERGRSPGRCRPEWTLQLSSRGRRVRPLTRFESGPLCGLKRGGTAGASRPGIQGGFLLPFFDSHSVEQLDNRRKAVVGRSSGS